MTRTPLLALFSFLFLACAALPTLAYILLPIRTGEDMVYAIIAGIIGYSGSAYVAYIGYRIWSDKD